MCNRVVPLTSFALRLLHLYSPGDPPNLQHWQGAADTKISASGRPSAIVSQGMYGSAGACPSLVMTKVPGISFT